ncbi:prophage antirepressor [Leptolyngbya sp. Heron Island J]|uniref:BRO-N domain-containing protein n=1 Tax=Leptolyngbya sp. Heron Island J TaxID=1385935 RepID=UPI0003B9BE6A|nr:BRO family protein [Leptolyngbya sp. Heron Island J]ESA37650.1 prophage antirepressor [Leptolyngbya sp. Heron Island J]
MSEIVLFNFESHDIRYVGDGIKHEWVATDVCAALNIRNSSQALDRLDDDEKGICLSDTPGGEQELLTVNEPGLYGLVLGSRKPEAKRFKRWLKHEVLPAIRKTGSYNLQKTDSTPKPEPLQLPPADVRIRDYANAMQYLEEKLGIDLQNPRMQQHYQDVINNIVLDSQKQLPPSKDRWMGIVEFAEKLGYKVTSKQAPILGKRAKAWFVAETGELPAEEDRLVNGRMCPVKLYNVTEYGEGLSQVVREYLGESGGRAAA